MTILTKRELKRRIHTGHIVVEPYDDRLVSENSINFRIGEELFVRACDGVIDLAKPSKWDLVEPKDMGDRRVHVLKPNTHYIAVTREAVGTRLLGDGLAFVPEMRARSTAGRHGISVALCAGMGDVGYCGRWAIELQNHNDRPVVLHVGAVIGQFVFHTATDAYPEDGYDGSDRYQYGEAIRFLPKELRSLDSRDGFYYNQQ